MSQNENLSVQDEKANEAVNRYEAPAVVYEGTIGTRAGSPITDLPDNVFDSPGPSIFD